MLHEFYVLATHVCRADPLGHEQAVDLIEAWLRFRVQEASVPILRGALATAAHWGISYWDAAIVEAAREAGCAILLSEDLQDGMDFLGVRVRNPFALAQLDFP